MSDGNSKNVETDEEGWTLFDLWDKYEAITMHFNDLLRKLRTQALAAVAALATIVGIFAKAGTNELTSWLMVAFAFAILTVFWLAVWMIDFLYYNRLLIGAVAALLELEERSKSQTRVRHIDISTKIEGAVAAPSRGAPPILDGHKHFRLKRGRWYFYVTVFVALLSGFAFATYKYWTTPT